MSIKKSYLNFTNSTIRLKQHIVFLYFNGKRKCDIIRKYGISIYLLNKWISQFNIEDLTNVNKSSLLINEKLFKLRKENQILKKQNNILRKAVWILGQK